MTLDLVCAPISLEWRSKVNCHQRNALAIPVRLSTFISNLLVQVSPECVCPDELNDCYLTGLVSRLDPVRRSKSQVKVNSHLVKNVISFD